MSVLLEIFGRAITVDTAGLIWHRLNSELLANAGWKSLQGQQLQEIIDLVRDMKLDAAQQQLRLYLFDNPSCVRGRLAAAAMCMQNNRLREAIEELNSVYLRQPNNTTALYALGHCYERLGKESEAVQFYQDCLKFKNYLQFPAQRLAAIHFKHGQLEKTIQQYDLLKDQYPDDISTLVTLGYLYIAAGKYAKAIEVFNTAILIHPDSFLIEDDYIDQLIRDGRLDEALQRLEVLLDSQPDRPELIAKQADVLGMLGATGEAISQYQQAIRLCPDFLEASIKLGTLYLQMDAKQIAAQQFNKAVEINDKIVDAYIGLATSQKLAANVSEALATLSLAAAIQPNSSLLFAQTASLLFQAVLAPESSLRQTYHSAPVIEAVIRAHRQQIARRPRNPDLHYRLGLLMMSVEALSAAADHFQAALEINPTYTRAKSKLAVCLLETGNKQAAVDHLTGPRHLDKDTLNLHYKTALLYCDKLKFASSLLNLDRYMEQNFASTETAVNVSVVLQNLGVLDRVAAMWDNLSDLANEVVTPANT